MATSRRDYVITQHVRERFLQRKDKKYNHLQFCREDVCPHCEALLTAIRVEISFERQKIDDEIRERVDRAEEDRACLNNSGFMAWYYEKYGFDKRFEFLIDDDLLFVVIHDEGSKVIVTCVSSKTHFAGKSHLAKSRFNRVKTKEEKMLESIIP